MKPRNIEWLWALVYALLIILVITIASKMIAIDWGDTIAIAALIVALRAHLAAD